MRAALFILCLMSSISLLAQTGNIKGKVNTSDGQPAAFVTVHLQGSSKGATTDVSGNYEIRKVAPGDYTLEVSFVGLETKEVAISVAAGQTTNVPTISLTEDSKQLDEVVVTGYQKTYKADYPSQSLRLQTPLLEIPQNIQVVTEKVLTDQQIISMSDGLIRNVSGAVRLEHWGDMYTNITMRGSQIQAFRNGFNVVNSYWGPLTEDMSIVDHVEFVKGPAGFMLANGDPSGLYNVVTKKPTGQTKGEASMTLGSFDLYRAALDLDGKLSKDGKLLYRFNVAAQNKKSHRDFEFNNRYTIAPVISYQLDAKTKLTAEYNLQTAVMSDVGSFYVFAPNGYAQYPVNFTALAPGLPPTRMTDHSAFLNLQHNLTADWKLTAQLAYFNYQQRGSSMWPRTVNPDGTLIRGVGIWDAKSAMTLGQVFLNGNVTTGGINHRILTGLDLGNKQYYADWSQSHPLDSVGAEFDPRNPYYGVPVTGYPVWDRSLSLEARAIAGFGTMDQRYTGLYLQDELSFFDNRLRLTLAGRYTDVSQSSFGGPRDKASHFTPRLGLSASVNKNTSIYALYDQAFIPQTGTLRSGGKISPITGSNIEFGIKKDWFDGRWNTTVSVYRIIKNNELTSDPNSLPGQNFSVVLGQKRAEGIELDIRGNLARGLTLTANYALTNSKVTQVTEGVTSIKVGDVLPGFAKHTTNAWLSYKLTDGVLKGLGINAGYTWMLDRATTNWSDSDTRYNLPDYFKLDGGLFWENNKVRVNVNVFNLMNQYLYSGGYYEYLQSYYWQTEAPRNLRLSLSYKF